MTDRRAARRRRPPPAEDGKVVPFDVTGVPARERVRGHDWTDGGAEGELEAGSFAARVESKRVNLVARVRDGVPPRKYHARSAGMFVVGKRHLIAAPKKSGKSFATLVQAVLMVLAGECIVILDRENGADLYTERLELIMVAWALTKDQRAVLEARLIYYDYPKLRREDPADLVRYFADELHADAVIFDSSRKFLTDFGLKENDSDDYDTFMQFAIEPLHTAGVTTVILDNTGHGDQTRSRGASGKGDLNEVLLHIEKTKAFDKDTLGQIKLVIDESRFGDHGYWTMQLGNGVFGEWQSDVARLEKVADDNPAFKAAAYAVIKAAGEVWGQRKVISAARDHDPEMKVGDHVARDLLKKWAADQKEPIRAVPERGYEWAV